MRSRALGGLQTRERKRSGSCLARFRVQKRRLAVWQGLQGLLFQKVIGALYRYIFPFCPPKFGVRLSPPTAKASAKSLSHSSGAASLSTNGWRRRGPSCSGAQGVTGRMRGGGMRGSAGLLCLALLGLAGQARAGTFLSANIRWVKKEGNQVRTPVRASGTCVPRSVFGAPRWGQRPQNPDLPAPTAHSRCNASSAR